MADASRNLENLLRLAADDPALRGVTADELSRLLRELDEPVGRPPALERWIDDLIEQIIPAGSSVLDLGCGNGELLSRLMQHKNIRGQGVELDAEAVFRCVERGVPVLQADLDLGLSGFGDASFDYVVLEETLQTLHRPAELLREVLRVGRRAVVAFPNFGYWRVRLGLALGGRMPRTVGLPFHWYDTPNIHLFTLEDFRDWAAGNGVRIVRGHALADAQVRELHEGDNLYAEEVLCVVEKAS